MVKYTFVSQKLVCVIQIFTVLKLQQTAMEKQPEKMRGYL